MHGTGDAGTSQLFQGQTAWFSSSVSSRNIKLWKEHGGLVAGIEHAQFVFSEDEEAEDTKQIFSSEAYIDEHLAVFHATYVSDAVKQDDGTKIPLGDYFLPPKDIQQLIKKQMKFKWDKESESKKEDDSTPDKEGDENEDLVMENCSRHSNVIHFDGEVINCIIWDNDKESVSQLLEGVWVDPRMSGVLACAQDPWTLDQFIVQASIPICNVC